MHANTAKALKKILQAAQAIRNLEEKAHAALHGQGDQKAHRALMVEKCLILVDLPDDIAQIMTGQEPEAAELNAGLADFRRRAGQALKLESIFYMSSLLYPDDYQPGQPNDLERFVERFVGP
jgi:hypothetical protein